MKVKEKTKMKYCMNDCSGSDAASVSAKKEKKMRK